VRDSKHTGQAVCALCTTTQTTTNALPYADATSKVPIAKFIKERDAQIRLDNKAKFKP
jgi:hypothetical protein